MKQPLAIAATRCQLFAEMTQPKQTDSQTKATDGIAAAKSVWVQKWGKCRNFMGVLMWNLRYHSSTAQHARAEKFSYCEAVA